MISFFPRSGLRFPDGLVVLRMVLPPSIVLILQEAGQDWARLNVSLDGMIVTLPYLTSHHLTLLYPTLAYLACL